MDTFLQFVVDGLVVGSVYALVALGFTLVFGVLKILNFAHPDIFMVGAYVGFFTIVRLGLPLPLAVATVVLTMVVLGFALEGLVLRHVRRGSELTPLIATFGVSIFLENLVVKLFGPQQNAFPSPIPPVFFNAGTIQFSTYHLVIFGSAACLMVGLTYLIDRTTWGKTVRATAEDAEVAQFLGVRTRRVVVWTLALSAVLAGLAGLAMGLFYHAITPFMGLTYGTKGLVIFILGGTGSMLGAMVGGLLMGLVEAMTVGYVSSSLRDGVAFLVLLLVLLVRPTGLFGQVREAKV